MLELNLCLFTYAYVVVLGPAPRRRNFLSSLKYLGSFNAHFYNTVNLPNLTIRTKRPLKRLLYHTREDSSTHTAKHKSCGKSLTWTLLKQETRKLTREVDVFGYDRGGEGSARGTFCTWTWPPHDHRPPWVTAAEGAPGWGGARCSPAPRPAPRPQTAASAPPHPGPPRGAAGGAPPGGRLPPAAPAGEEKLGSPARRKMRGCGFSRACVPGQARSPSATAASRA